MPLIKRPKGPNYLLKKKKTGFICSNRVTLAMVAEKTLHENRAFCNTFLVSVAG